MMPFVIFSLSRCGSTALFRALNAHTEIQCKYEPSFAEHHQRTDSIVDEIKLLQLKYSGIKHVWDPSGFPFTASHISVLDNLTDNIGHVLYLNKLILTIGSPRVVFLYRRNQLDRLLSDLLGQQTDVWTPSFPRFPEASIESLRQDSAAYKKAVKNSLVKPIDTRIVDWYMTNVPHFEAEFESCVDASNKFTVYYEDMFSPERTIESKLEIYRQILDFIGYSSTEKYFDVDQVKSLFDNIGKLNDETTMQMIPNLIEIRNNYY